MDLVRTSVQPGSCHKHSQQLHLHPPTVHKHANKIVLWRALQKKLLMKGDIISSVIWQLKKGMLNKGTLFQYSVFSVSSEVSLAGVSFPFLIFSLYSRGVCVYVCVS